MSRPRAPGALVAPILLALAGGCQLLIGLDGGTPRPAGSGGGGAGGGTTTASTTTSTTGSTGGAGTGGSGTGGAGTGGTGGADAGVDSGTDSGSDAGVDSGTDAGVDAGSDAGGDSGADGGPCTTPTTCGQVLLLAGSTSQPPIASVYDLTGWSTPATLVGPAAADLAITYLPATGQGIGVVHTASTNLLDYTLWNGTTWSSLAQVNLDSTMGPPTIVATGATGASALAVYWGTDYKYYYETFSGGAWAAASQPFAPTGATAQCYGPSPGMLAPLAGGEASFVFVNGGCGGTVNHLLDSDTNAGVWQAVTDLASDPSYAALLRPAVVAPVGPGPELVAAFVAQGTQQVWSTARTGGAWSAPVMLSTVLTNDPVALAPLATGGAVMAYRGGDTHLYTVTYSGGTWSTPVAPLGATILLQSTPSVAKGVGTAAAELAYVTEAGAVYHSRLVGVVWTTPTMIEASGFTSVAIASGP